MDIAIVAARLYCVKMWFLMSVCLGFESSKHAVCIGSFGWIWYLLKYIPMFYDFSIRIEPENINSCYAPVIGIIIIQIKKIYMCPCPVATCNNMMYYYTQIFPCSSNAVKELA